MFSLNKVTITGAVRGFRPAPTNAYWVSVTDQVTYSPRGSVSVDDNGGIYVAGTGTAPLFLKFGVSGSIEWQKTFSATTPSLRSVAIYEDNVYFTATADATLKEYIFNFTQAGELTWKKRLSFYASNHTVHASATDSEGNLYTVGNIPGFPSTGQDGVIVKTDNTGAIVWQKRFSPASASSTETIYSVTCAGTDLYVGMATFLTGAIGTVIAKISSSGTLVWQRKLDTAGDAALTNDGTDIYYAGSLSNKPWLVKISSTGTLLWQKNLDAAGYYQSADVDSSGNIYCGARVTTGATGTADVVLVKYDSAGNIMWQNRIATAVTDAMPLVNVKGTAIALAFNAGSNLVVARLPLDGTFTGTAGIVTFSPTAFSNATTATSTTTPVYVLTNITLSSANATAITVTDAALTVTNSTVG